MSAYQADTERGRGTVYPGDCDHMGHMNVASYVRKFDEATWALWSSVGMTVGRMNHDQIGIAALESQITYTKELFPGDNFIVRSRFVWVKPKTARFHHRLYVLQDNGSTLNEVQASTCTYTVACLDRHAHMAQPWPEDVHARILPVLRTDQEGETK